MIQDNNKGIDNIGYNAQDLPVWVQGTKGTVSNTYDAGGGLLEKRITPAAGAPVVYRYLGPLVFKDDSLSYALHAEGRCRWLGGQQKYQYDYFVKDHLGNVRTVITTEPGAPQYYVATYENSRALEEGSVFDHMAEVRDDNDIDPQPGDLKVALLDGSDPNRRIGSSLMLKVMAGDEFDISVDAAYDGEVDPKNNDYARGTEMLESLIGALTSGATVLPEGEGSANSELVSRLFHGSDFLGTYQALKDQVYDPAYPRSYLGYAFFDEHLKLVAEESGMLQVTQDASGTWKTIGKPRIHIPGNGFFTVFTVNEDYNTPVRMNNLAVTYSRGRLLEEQHYYPHGLVADEGNSNPVANRFLYQGKELQDEAGLQLYDFGARQYDPQIGRFWGIDPMDQFPSGYTGMGNSPSNMVDPDGMQARWTPSEAPNEPAPLTGDGELPDGAYAISQDNVENNSAADPGQGDDDTHVYNNETGNLLGTIKDDHPGVASVIPVDPSREGEVTQSIDAINAKTQEAINNAGDFVRMT